MKVDIEKVIDWLLENTSEVTEQLTENYSVTYLEFDFYDSKEELIEGFRKDMEE
jgi:ferritin-like protein